MDVKGYTLNHLRYMYGGALRNTIIALHSLFAECKINSYERIDADCDLVGFCQNEPKQKKVFNCTYPCMGGKELEVWLYQYENFLTNGRGDILMVFYKDGFFNISDAEDFLRCEVKELRYGNIVPKDIILFVNQSYPELFYYAFWYKDRWGNIHLRAFRSDLFPKGLIGKPIFDLSDEFRKRFSKNMLCNSNVAPIWSDKDVLSGRLGLIIHEFYKNKIDWVTECLKKRKLFGRWNEDYDKKQFGLTFSNSLMI